MEVLKQFERAQALLKEVVLVTPIVKAGFVKKDFDVYLKCENLQSTGSFKIRGASYKMACLSDEEKAKGVIAASAGNHAQGVANAAKKLGINALIVMPKGAPLAKVEATAEYGVTVMLEGDTFDEAYSFAKQLQKESGRIFIEPFDDEHVVIGQGTIGMEILEQLPQVDTVIVPIGGGGIAAGVALAIKAKKPGCRVVGVQSEAADAMKRSVEQGFVSSVNTKTTIADGIAVKTPGEFTWNLCKNLLDEIVVVSDDEIAYTIVALMEKMKQVSEGAGAAALAACIYNKINFAPDEKVVAIVSGGNIDITLLSRIINRGLVKSGRKVTFGITLFDKPGQLCQLLNAIGEDKANIVSIVHDRNCHDVKAGFAYVEIELETTNQLHINKLKEILTEMEFKVSIVE